MVWSDIAVFVCLNRQSPFESSLQNRLGQTGHAGTACDGLNWLPPDNIMSMIGCGRASMNGDAVTKEDCPSSASPNGDSDTC